jgi:signal transduction histidine kinase
MRRLIGNWRPRLGSVVLGILLIVLVLPLVGLFFFRLYENQLIRQTEAELIAQAAAISAVFAAEVKREDISADRLGGPARPPRTEYFPDGRYTPVEPGLDLTMDPILEPRPPALPGEADPVFAELGERLFPIMMATQKMMLAGFRLVDPHGVVIAGRDEVGQSIANVPEVAQALAGSYASVLRQRISNEPPPPLYSMSRGAKVRVFVAMPVIVDDRVAGAVYLSRTPNNIVKHLYGERGKVALSALTVLAATLLIGFVFVRVISRPMKELLERTRRIAAGDAEAIRPLSHHGTREMAQLASGFLDMARKLQDRSDTIRTFATHVSHELKSPLTSIQGAAELLRDGGEEMSPADRKRFHANIAADSDRLNRLVQRLIELARAENVGPTSQSATLDEAVRSMIAPSQLSVEIVAGAETAFRMSADNAVIVLSNLADNSARHGASRLTLSAWRQDDTVTIIAEDDGDGIAPGVRARVFEPFFTTRRQAGGTGLGLGIVTALLKAHNGSIILADAARGARFEISLPAA